MNLFAFRESAVALALSLLKDVCVCAFGSHKKANLSTCMYTYILLCLTNMTNMNLNMKTAIIK